MALQALFAVNLLHLHDLGCQETLRQASAARLALVEGDFAVRSSKIRLRTGRLWTCCRELPRIFGWQTQLSLANRY